MADFAAESTPSSGPRIQPMANTIDSPQPLERAEPMLDDSVMDRLFGKLDAVQTGIASLKATLEATCPECQRRLGKLEDKVHGNGEGLETKVTVLEKSLTTRGADQSPATITIRLPESGKQWSLLAAILAALLALPILGGKASQTLSKESDPPAAQSVPSGEAK